MRIWKVTASEQIQDNVGHNLIQKIVGNTKHNKVQVFVDLNAIKKIKVNRLLIFIEK
jgi:hypothetical protein